MTKAARLLFASWLTVACTAGSSTPCLANSAVTLKPDLQTERATVKLSDLFAGVPAEIDRDVAQAPLPCHPAVYNEEVLNKLADTYRLDWTPAPDANHVTISTSCTRISGDMIRDAVIARIKTVNPLLKDRNFDIAFDTRNLEIDLPGGHDPDFKLDNFTYDAGARQFRTDLIAQTSRGPYSTNVTGRVSARRSVPVVAHRLEGGTTIAESDIDWVELPEERVTADIVTEASQLVGHETRRDIAEGDMFRAHDVIPARFVQRGSLVTMKIQTPFITVTAQGKSQQDGTLGDVVRVINTDSNRVVQGTVIAPGVVEIHTAQKLAAAE